LARQRVDLVGVAPDEGLRRRSERRQTRFEACRSGRQNRCRADAGQLIFGMELDVEEL